MLGDDPPGGFDAVQVWHLQVHEDHIRFQGADFLDDIQAIDRLADDVDPWVAFEEACQSGAEQRLIVGDQDPRDGDLRVHSDLITSILMVWVRRVEWHG